MLTVTGLARRCGLSRSTVLYYESIGLLKPSGRTLGNYRQYGEKDTERLRQICAYRHVGLSLADIRSVLGHATSDAASVLQRRLLELDAEIETLRSHQRGILRLLEHKGFRRAEMITKEKWVGIMKGCGFSDDQMHAWHVEFERSAPAEHQEFLEFLHIPVDEIKKIREWSKKGGKG
ncbi:MAG TPA: MerR family transcriptional regulator [Vicinamibacterales bacterium]|jgi:DNA-binding transcriptional MerR regulator